MIVHQVSLDALPVLEPKAWRDDVLRRHLGGARMVTMFGSPAGEKPFVTTVFRDLSGAIDVTRTRPSVEFGYHELTSEWPALHCFERELHEQTGMRIAGHPWLKPVRFEGQSQGAMDSYPFYKVEGKEVHEVAVGPIHAGVIEPGAFRFMCLGEQVHHLEIHLGYQHRGVERLLLRGDPTRLAPLAETIAGDSSVAHAWAYCSAVEALSGCTLPDERTMGRGFLLELERVAMHLATLSGLAADIGFLQGASTYGRLRTTAINTLMRLTGSRFGRGALRPGGARITLDDSSREEVAANLALLQRDLATINECFLDAQTVRHRLQGVGVLSRERAEELGAVGLVARASGLRVDARQQVTEGAYKVLALDAVVHDGGDCWARTRLRVDELAASLRWLEVVLGLYGRWRPSPTAPLSLNARQLVVAMVEGWRGEVVHCLETGETGELVHYKVQDPSMRNWMGLALAVRANEISDFPICNKSFDLSYCGNDL